MKSEKATFAGAGGDTLAARLESRRGRSAPTPCSRTASPARRTSLRHRASQPRWRRTELPPSASISPASGRAAAISPTPISAPMSAIWSRRPTWLRAERAAPSILIGHSLGGAAVLAAAEAVDEAVGVATIGAPSDPAHVSHLFGAAIETIERDGEAEVRIAGRPFRIRRQFLDDIAGQRLREPRGRLPQGVACPARTARPDGRDRQRGGNLPGREAPEELRLARRRGPSADAARGRGLCGGDGGRLGKPLPSARARSCRRARGRRGGELRKTESGLSDRTSRPGIIA